MALGDTMLVACESFCAVSDIDCDCDNIATSVVEEAIDQASDALAIMTGHRVKGQCTETVRPRGPSPGTCYCPRAYGCTCAPLRGVTLRGPDPTSITVTIDGAAFTDFQVVDGRLLMRTDGQLWPGCQDLSLANNADGAFTVTYTYGLPIPLLGKNAAVAIVCSLLNNPPAQRRSQHPGTRQVQIAGVTISLESMLAEIKRRTMLLPDVIRFLTVYAPEGTAQPVVYSPELEDGWVLHRLT